MLTLYQHETWMMESMIRIGEFAKLCKVSVATLRLYDEEGILRPAHVDPQSGYRSYLQSQMVEMHRVSVLKELGFTLKEIQGILREHDRPESLSAMLDKKRADSEAEVQRLKQKIKRTELQIRIVEGLQTMTSNDVTTLQLPDLRVAGIRFTIPMNDQAGPMLDSAFQRLFAALSAQGISPTKPCFAVWESTPDDVVNEIVTAAVEIDESAFEPVDGFGVMTIPGAFVASLTHRGDFSEFQTCHIVLKEWMATNGYELDGPYREVYGCEPNGDRTTVVQYPIKKIG